MMLMLSQSKDGGKKAENPKSKSPGACTTTAPYHMEPKNFPLRKQKADCKQQFKSLNNLVNSSKELA